MTVTNSGDVGIGTPDPGAKLDVHVDSGGAATIGHSSNSADGEFSIATGHGTYAGGYHSTAMGSSTFAFGEYSTAMGVQTNATGLASTAMGAGSIASGYYSVAMGQGSKALGWGSTAMGGKTTAIGEYPTAMGYNTTASGWYSTSMGYGTTAFGWYSTAMGTETTANGWWSTALGSSITVDGHYSVGIGLDDIPRNIPVTRPNTMAIMGGSVGIGTVEPSEKLHVAGRFIRVDGTGNEQAYIGGDGIGNNVQVGSLNSGVNDVVLWNHAAGSRMNLWSSNVDVVGTIKLTDVPIYDDDNEYDLTWNPSTHVISKEGSSLRYKQNIGLFQEDFHKILELDVMQYQMKEGHGDPDKWLFGYIAEDLDDIGLNKLVIYDSQGRPDGIHYKKMGIYLNEIVKEHEQEITILSSELDILSSEISISEGIGVGIGTFNPTSPLQVVGLPVYENNAAAVAGGLTPGAFYRTGDDPDLVAVVH
jgi:hypothetical protein